MTDAPPAAPPEPTDIFRVGDVLSGTYEIRRVLGAGGMGQVFEAQDLRLNRRVAVKAAWPHLEDSAVRKEAQALAAIRHPGMVAVFTVAEHEGVEYVVMERVLGTSLETHLYRRQQAGEPLTPLEVVDLLIAITDALTAVHQAGIAHRDVKPANVMLAPGGRVVLMDFGLFLPEFEVALQSTIAGSPQYMAPEAITNTVEPGAGALVDLYALGVLAFEMLTGDPPFLGETPDEVWDKHLYEPAPDVAERLPELPPPFARLIRMLLEKDPSLRPQSADHVLFQLRAIRAAIEAEEKEAPFSVLVADADRELQRVLSSYIKKAVADAEVRVVSTGSAAVDSVRAQPPDVLLLDLHLPRMSGLEVCMYLRGEGFAPGCDITIFASGASEDDLQLLRALGVGQFLLKGADLATRVGEHVRHVRRTRRDPRHG